MLLLKLIPVSLSLYLILGFQSIVFGQIVNAPANLDEVQNVMAFGDSQTTGVGAARDESYPARVSQYFGIPIANLARGGLTTERALADNGQLDQALTAMPNPDVVMMTLGGNDILNDKRATRKIVANLAAIFKEFQDRGAMVIYVGTDPTSNWRNIDNPQSFLLPIFWGSYYSSIRDLCDDMGVLFVEKAMDGVWGDSRYMADSIHPNAAGYQIMADRIVDTIEGAFQMR